MAPRLSKRQQREQDELLSLGQSSKQALSDEEHSDEDAGIRPSGGPAGFAALVAEGSDDGYEEDDPQASKAKKSKRKKKKGSAAQPEETTAPEASQPTKRRAAVQHKKSIAPKPKGKGKGKKVEEDDLEKALAELSVKYPDLKGLHSTSTAFAAGAKSVSDRQNALLAVSLQNLDSEAEMRRFFGSKVVTATTSRSRPPRGGRTAAQNVKSNLTKPQPTWPPASLREGLSIRAYDEAELSEKRARSGIDHKDERWWTIEYSKKYRSVTKVFLDAVMAGDPDGFYGILRTFHWHADTLLQMSEVYRHREEHADYADLLNRALFTYERGFIGAFTFTSGSNRLDFDRVENRPFYLTLGRLVTDLQRRGCVRSAFEFAKLLLSLDPYTDPHGALLYVDFLALKAGMHEWLLDMWDLHSEEGLVESSEFKNGLRFNVTALPGWLYARALALRAREEANKNEDHEESNAALREAILAFPSVVPLVADKADIILPGSLRGHDAFRVHVDASGLAGPSDAVLHLFSHLYAHRSASLWKVPANASWLHAVASETLPSVRIGSIAHPLRIRLSTLMSSKSFLALSVYRHAYLLADANAARRLTAFFPRELLQIGQLSCDPFPPATSQSLYDEAFFLGVERSYGQDQERVHEFFVRALYDANPRLQQIFPDGVQQFQQALVGLPIEMLERLLAGENIFDVPGAFPGQMQFFADITDDEDNNDGAAEANGAVREGQDNVASNNAADAQPDDDAEAHGPSGPTAPAAHDATEASNSSGADNGDVDNADESIYPVRVLRSLMNRLWGAPAEPVVSDTGSDPSGHGHNDASDGSAGGGEPGVRPTNQDQ